MGLDKKPTPPPKRVKEDRTIEEQVISRKDCPEMKTKMNEEDAASNSDCETGQPHDMETRMKGGAAAEEKVRDGTDTIPTFVYNTFETPVSCG